ncbi:MAG TPA: LamG-like jellyroll fold domain-containing protein [Verrucomicrobiae bacterium]|nr:LamG-like jellyroll fold domain-containing protein [Verrucomicrobiae bacterium]
MTSSRIQTSQRLGRLIAALTFAVGLWSVQADYHTTVLGDGPAGYWRFSETPVVTPPPLLATNLGSAGAVNNGGYLGNFTRGVAGVLAGSTATYFTGGGWVQVPNTPTLNPNPPFSVEFWIKPNPAAGALTCPLSSTDFTPTPRLGWLFYTDDGYAGGYVNGGYYFRVYSSDGTKAAVSPAGLLTANWTHVVGVVDGVNVLLYVNGQQVGSTSWSGTFTPNVAQSLGIGTRYDGGFPQDGTMNEVAIYASALSATDVKAHYDAATTNAAGYAAQILAANPVGYWRLNEPLDVHPVAVNSGSAGPSVNGAYYYSSTTTPDLQGPTFAGFETTNTVFEPSGTNGVVAIPPLNLNTNTVTFECWIKRNGAQASYAGIIFHRGGSGTATGMDFHDVSNDLGYHWSDQANTYGWDSLLSPPDGVWTYAALAVAPSQATIYMYDGTNWSSAVNVVDHPAQAFAATTLVGADNGPGRAYNGLLDEAAIYGQTLTEGQLHTHALAGFGSSSPPAFVVDPPVVTPAGVIYTTTPFTVAGDAYGAPPLSFQWVKDGTNLPGASRFSYSKAAATANDAGNYSLVVTNLYGAITSQVAVVTINPAVPPTLTNPPLSRFVYAGGTASFTVGAAGTTPFSYQWQHAGTNLPGATEATLFVTNCTAAQTGAYTVGVTNVTGGIVGSPAILTLRTPAANSFEAAVVNGGPLAYWRLNEASGTVALDYMGGYDSTHVGGVTVGQPGPVPPQFPGFESGNLAVQFDGTTSSSSSPGVTLLNNRTNFTLCGWVNPVGIAQGGLFGQNNVVEFRFLNSTTIELWTSFGSIDYPIGNAITAGNWSFIAASGSSNTLNLYINGQRVATAAATATSGYGSYTDPFLLSGNTSGNGDPSISGLMDEVAVYPRTLSDAEIAGLYAAGAYGTVTAPFVTQQPNSQTVQAGNTVSISGAVVGSLPLSYQWKKDGANLPGATGPSLTLSNVYFTDAGSYVLWATNSVGHTNTAAATLTVMPIPTFANQTNALVLHLRFDGNYLDSSGRGNDAYAPTTFPPFIAGKVGQAVHIDTTPGNNYLVINDLAGDLTFDETASFSVAFWIRYTDRFNDDPIIGNSINSTYQLGWVFTDEGGKIECSLVSTANSGTYVANPVAGSPIIGDGLWHHVVGVVDRTTQLASVYVDGVSAGSWSIVGLGTLNSTYSITIGQDPTGSYGSAVFDLDDLGIWRRALSAYDAASVYGAAENSGESFDVYGPVKVSLNRVGANLDLSWQAGRLLQSTSVTGPYTPVPAATVPFYRTTASGSAMFFRVAQ